MALRQVNNTVISRAGMLLALAIIFGDIGTSPLYVMNAIVGEKEIQPTLILGGLSCIFWTLTMITSVKYIIILLRADNKGEGGIFSLFAQVRRMRFKGLYVLAMIGGAALMADGLITPPISITAALEGLTMLHAEIPTMPVIIIILFSLFFVQQFGTRFVARFFGPVMMVWFSMLLLTGMAELVKAPGILKAINPYYAYELLANHPGGFWLLGAVFLCTTGAEALYFDLGVCGRKNITATWMLVKAALLVNYFGQGVWLLQHTGQKLGGLKPFYALMPEWFLPFGIVIATAAAVVASQALISSTFTLINEGMRLDFLPKGRIEYPTDYRGQIYIPSINWLLCLGCIAIVWYFRSSENMQAAYGLAITITMLMTSLLLCFYLFLKRYSKPVIITVFIVFVGLESTFLFANLDKFMSGGWVVILLSLVIFVLMWFWHEARTIRTSFLDFVPISDHYEIISDISADTSIPKYATHLVYLTASRNKAMVENKIIYSILRRQPKRADIYWLVHVDLLDEPYTIEYQAEELVNDKIVYVRFRLGFRVEPRINLLLRQVVQELVANKEVDVSSRYESLQSLKFSGDFRFIVMEKFFSYESTLSFYDKLVLNAYFFMKRFSLSEEKTFGLDSGSVLVEKVPLIVTPRTDYQFRRVF